MHVQGLYDFVLRLEIIGSIIESVTENIAVIDGADADAGRMYQLHLLWIC
jgi:hypothetical protein